MCQVSSIVFAQIDVRESRLLILALKRVAWEGSPRVQAGNWPDVVRPLAAHQLLRKIRHLILFTERATSVLGICHCPSDSPLFLQLFAFAPHQVSLFSLPTSLSHLQKSYHLFTSPNTCLPVNESSCCLSNGHVWVPFLLSLLSS